jgi:hypothetical protein
MAIKTLKIRFNVDDRYSVQRTHDTMWGAMTTGESKGYCNLDDLDFALNHGWKIVDTRQVKLANDWIVLYILHRKEHE